MTAIPGSLGDFCHYALDFDNGRSANDPVMLGNIFRDYTGIKSTPGLTKTVELVRSFGIRIAGVTYLDTGGTNMTAKGLWHIHYSVKDRPGTQKFDIFHELFEIIHKNLGEADPDFKLLKEPLLSQAADRFAASVLIPRDFFLEKIGVTGCDLVKLSEELGLSHQCLLVALGQNIVDFPFVGALYEHQPATSEGKVYEITEYSASLVIKTGQARMAKELCWLQAPPVRNGHPQYGSLVCASITGGRPVLWRSSDDENAPIILVRPLLNTSPKPYR
jgi:Zn-dependent peptidase ImmA (M78 family)